MAGQEGCTKRLLLKLAALVLIVIVALSFRHDFRITGIYYRLQDAPGGLALVGLLAITAFWRPGWHLPTRFPEARFVWLAAGLLVLLLWVGTYVVMLDYPLTRDEHMAVFDAAVYGKLALSAPLPLEWYGYGTALSPDFLIKIPGHVLMVSDYMPGNAAMRATFALVADPALLNPMLAGIGLIALHRVCLVLFPDSPGAVWVSLGGYALSAQIIVNAMTTYAMTAHLAFNCVWLALFLKDRRWSHVAAMVVGAWAIGLHQIVFHPLFAGPLILTLLCRRRWGLFAAYSVVYAAALLFWISYGGIVTQAAGVAAAAGSAAGASGFLTERVLPLLLSMRPSALPLMMYNLLRFLVFAPVFLLPLLAFSRGAVRENEGLALPLFAGILLTLLAMTILLPFQGHGWGYRYLHAVLPNFLLLSGYGYRAWAGRSRADADGTVILMGACSAALVLPFLLFTSHQFVQPHARLAKLVERQKADFVIVEMESMPRTVDNVRNSPWLTNRPLVFSSRHLSAEQPNDLCRRGSVTILSQREFYRSGFISDPREALPKSNVGLGAIRRKSCFRAPTI